MKTAEKLRVAVAVSGAGRSLENLLRASAAPESTYTVNGVIASRPDIRACDIARNNHLPLLVLPFTNSSLPETENALYEWLNAQKIDLVALAGFLKLFPVRDSWHNRVINIHPALLPKHGGKGMYGHRVHNAVVRAGDHQSGATIHFVNSRYDEGRIIAQVTVDIKPNQTVEEVAALVFAAECQLFPRVLRALAAGDLPLKNNEIYRCAYDPS